MARPTGELPKRNSKLAKNIASRKSEKLSPAQARAAAGKYRDSVKASGAKTLDETGAALGKAIKSVKNASANKPTAKPKNKENIVQDITNRFRVTAREARDIVTAVSTAVDIAKDPKVGNKGSRDWAGSRASNIKKAVADIGTQAKETVRAAKTGKSGKSAGYKSTVDNEAPFFFAKGAKRK